MAWNWGQRVAAAGLALDTLGPDAVAVWVLGFGMAEAEAEARLGPEGFRAWAVRGWIDGGRERGP